MTGNDPDSAPSGEKPPVLSYETPQAFPARASSIPALVYVASTLLLVFLVALIAALVLHDWDAWHDMLILGGIPWFFGSLIVASYLRERGPARTDGRLVSRTIMFGLAYMLGWAGIICLGSLAYAFLPAHGRFNKLVEVSLVGLRIVWLFVVPWFIARRILRTKTG